jgi:hypothetical protein
MPGPKAVKLLSQGLNLFSCLFPGLNKPWFHRFAGGFLNGLAHFMTGHPQFLPKVGLFLPNLGQFGAEIVNLSLNWKPFILSYRKIKL